MTETPLILDHVITSIAEYREGKLNFQSLVNAIDALRTNSDLPADKLDQVYLELEIINASRIDERRNLDDHDHQQITALLKTVEAEIEAAKES